MQNNRQKEKSFSEKLSEKLALPGAQYRGKPFWAWNGELDEDEVRRQVRVFAEMGFGGFFIHSRAGLRTEYMGQDWLRMVDSAVDEAENCGLQAWLYDEDCWPSGSAGGAVSEDEGLRMKSLVLSVFTPSLYELRKSEILSSGDIFMMFLAQIDGINLLAYKKTDGSESPALWSASLKENEKPEKSRTFILVFRIIPEPAEGGGSPYADTMNPRAVDRFIELTHEKYKEHLGDRFGGAIKGIFTDEPHRGHAMDNTSRGRDGSISVSLFWTDDIFSEFENRFGYDAARRLPEIFFRKNGELVSDVRHDYFDLGCSLFCERYAKRIDEWCIESGITFTGHILHEDSLTNQAVPCGSVMRFYEHMSAPGVDVLTEGNRCYWIVKQLTSAARQTGKQLLLSELYGCTGWQTDMDTYRRIGEWQAFFGINLRCPHLSYYTMEGQAKRDYPASIFFQSPWYRYFESLETYFSRFGMLLSEAIPQCDILVINPVESAFSAAHIGWADWVYSADDTVKRLEAHYAGLFMALCGDHIEFDYGDEEMLSRLSSVNRDERGRAVLNVGDASYRTVLISGLITVRSSTLGILRKFVSSGGRVVFTSDIPRFVDARRSTEAEEFASYSASLGRGVIVPPEGKKLCNALRDGSAYYVSLSRADGGEEKDVFARCFTLSDEGHIMVSLLNTDRENPRKELLLRVKTGKPFHTMQLDISSDCFYDAEGGAVYSDGYMCVRLSLQKGETKFYIFGQEKEKLPPPPQKGELISRTELSGEFDFRLSEKNACVLDFVRWSCAGVSGRDECLRADKKIRSRLGLPARSAMPQPWKVMKSGIKRGGAFSVEYDFFIEEMPREVFLCVERPCDFTLTLNKHPVKYIAGVGEMWIDSAFRAIPLDLRNLRFGQNTIGLSGEYTALSSVEAVYLTGDFGVSVGSGLTATVCAMPHTLVLGELYKQKLPFYTWELSYSVKPSMIPHGISEALDSDVFLSVEFGGAMIIICAEGFRDIYIYENGGETDITEIIRSGKVFEIKLVGTRRNLFGPLHHNPPIIPAYGPDCFIPEGKNFDERYMFVPAGLRSIALIRRKKVLEKGVAGRKEIR